MTAPRFAPCRCAHSKDDHDREGFRPQCTATSCTCLAYRPAAVQPTPPRSTAPAALVHSAASLTINTPSRELEELLAAAKRADDKRIVALADKVLALADDLRERLSVYEKQASARKRVADLEAQLKAARAALGGGSVKPPTSPRTGDATCPDCGKDGWSNLGVHRSKAHGWRKDGAA